MKSYQKPEYCMIRIVVEDILTMSEVVEGKIENVGRYTFDDLIRG